MPVRWIGLSPAGPLLAPPAQKAVEEMDAGPIWSTCEFMPDQQN